MTTGLDSALSFDMETPTLADVMRAAIRSSSLDLRVAFPATVSKVNDSGKTVDVQADQNNVVFTEDEEQTQQLLEIAKLPVMVYGRGSATGGYLQFPVMVGDKGLVIVNDRSLNDWYKNGTPAPPPHYHAHNVTDGVFFPGLRDDTRGQEQESVPDTAVLESLLIKLGESASEAAVLGNALNTWIGQLRLWLSAHIHAAPTGSTGPPTVLPVPSPGVILSTKVKIE